MLYLIGLGLGDEKDLTLNSLDVIKNCSFVYLENYTSFLVFDVKKLESLIGKNVILAEREFVETSDEMINNALNSDVAFLVKGDVFSATTHVDLFLRAVHHGIRCSVLHNSSVLTAVSDTGLSLYKFGRVVSIPFDYNNVYSSYETFSSNGDSHTLFLLDLKPSENKFMNFKDGFNYLLNKSGERNDSRIGLDTMCVVCAALGTDKAVIKYGKICDLLNFNIDAYPQCIIIPGKTHFVEEEVLNLFRL